MSTDRQPWEVGRFLRTAAFFGAFSPAAILRPFLPSPGPSGASPKLRPGAVIWDASNPLGLQWGPLDDVVMGGASQSSFEGTAWRGTVTTANNGGFAGVRTRQLSPPLDLSACKGVELTIEGDGQRYKFILRDDQDWNGVAWTKPFDTAGPGRETKVRVAFTELVPTRFAATVPLDRGFDNGRVTALQLTLSKFEFDGGLNPKFRPGDFAVRVKRIVGY